jgi:hypothetical protein
MWDSSSMTPQPDRYSVMRDGGAWDRRANTPSNLSGSLTPLNQTLPLAGSSVADQHSGAGASTEASSTHWLASAVLQEALHGVDIVVKNSHKGLLEQRIYLSKMGGLIVAREGKRTTKSAEGNLVPFGEIEQAAIAGNPERARKLFIVVRGPNVSKIGRSVGKWVNTSNQYDFRLAPVQLHMKGAGKWVPHLEETSAEFTASHGDLVVIHETAHQMQIGNNNVAHIRLKHTGGFW